jgi:hypothetical protein
MKRVVRPGGIIAVVLGPSILDRKKPDSIEVARLLAESSDLEFIGGVLRPLKKTRRSLPPPEVVPEKSELAVRMACEAIVVLRKRNHK